MTWAVVLLPEVQDWYMNLDNETTIGQVTADIDRLETHGPTLGRPTADRIEGSRIHNLKELRPGTVRIPKIATTGG